MWRRAIQKLVTNTLYKNPNARTVLKNINNKCFKLAKSKNNTFLNNTVYRLRTVKFVYFYVAILYCKWTRQCTLCRYAFIKMLHTILTKCNNLESRSKNEFKNQPTIYNSAFEYRYQSSLHMMIYKQTKNVKDLFKASNKYNGWLNIIQ